MAHKVKGCYLKELIIKFIFMADVVLILIYSDFKQISLNSAFIKAEASKNTQSGTNIYNLIILV